MKCPECGSTNTQERKHWTGQDYITWSRCIACGLKFNEKGDKTMKTCKALKFDTVKCMICEDKIATVQVKIQDPMEVNILTCAFCAGFPENELVDRVLRKEGDNHEISSI